MQQVNIRVLFSDLKNEYQLYEAVIKNDADAVRKVLKETVDVNTKNNVSHNPFTYSNLYGSHAYSVSICND